MTQAFMQSWRLSYSSSWPSPWQLRLKPRSERAPSKTNQDKVPLKRCFSEPSKIQLHFHPRRNPCTCPEACDKAHGNAHAEFSRCQTAVQKLRSRHFSGTSKLCLQICSPVLFEDIRCRCYRRGCCLKGACTLPAMSSSTQNEAVK